jgi:hypothetical protein
MYIATAIYLFVRPTSMEYFRVNQLRFSQDFTKAISTGKVVPLLSNIAKAIVDHLFSLNATGFFSFLLLSLGFALIYRLAKDFDTDLAEGTEGYFKLAVLSLFSTILIVGSNVPTAEATSRVPAAEAVAIVSAALSLLLYAWNKWGKDLKERPTPNAVPEKAPN